MKQYSVTCISGALTGKGKSYQSYQWIDGKIIPLWHTEHGGIEKIKAEIINNILKGDDMHQIRIRYNISSATIKNFIKKYIPPHIITLELNNRKTNSSNRRSVSLLGGTRSSKGKTYSEIYGTKTPGCGFKRGDKNPNFTRNRFIGCKVIDKYGNRFRSTYEAEFSELLHDNSIPYEYEHHYKMCNGKVKIVDFTVNGCLVEVTGYAYKKWQDDFDVKIELLLNSYKEKTIVIVSRNDGKSLTLSKLKARHTDSRVHVLDLDDPDSILNFF